MKFNCQIWWGQRRGLMIDDWRLAIGGFREKILLYVGYLISPGLVGKGTGLQESWLNSWLAGVML
jgi:hypothetical protein